MAKRKADPADGDFDPAPADILEAEGAFQNGEHRLLGRGVRGVVGSHAQPMNNGMLRVFVPNRLRHLLTIDEDRGSYQS